MNDQRLSNLMTYTVFHIGVYISLLTALIAAGIFVSLDNCLIRVAVAFFVGAGIAGSIIGSNIPNYPDADTFFSSRFGFRGRMLHTYEGWARLEHSLFWIGFFILIVPYLSCGPDAFKAQ